MDIVPEQAWYRFAADLVKQSSNIYELRRFSRKSGTRGGKYSEEAGASHCQTRLLDWPF